MRTPIDLDSTMERFLVFDTEMDPHCQVRMTEEDRLNAALIIQVIYDPVSGFTKSKMILNRVGEA